ncbi:MAG TPA: FAD:protein FMN transferase [Clostridiales bacterium]|nr:FAD:protein FMN transferase [Clostridiales bacterium]
MYNSKSFNKLYKSLILTLILFLTIPHLFACDFNSRKTPVPISKSTYLLNTIITITIYDKPNDEILNQTFKLIEDYEKIFSRTNKTSELYALNKRLITKTVDNTYLVSDELAYLIRKSLYFCELSNGYFDISVAPLSDLWDFGNSDKHIPDKSDIDNILSLINYKDIRINRNEVVFENDKIEIDLGATAKGYIADKAKEFLISKGVKSAIINLGGNVLTLGNKPNGEPFKIGLQKPFADRNEIISTMLIDDLSVVSSGIYERFFIENNLLYHHILNPANGYPYDNNLNSVTIISKSSLDCDALSTICLALGLEDGLRLINRTKDTYAVFITKDYQLHYSDGFKENIELVN